MTVRPLPATGSFTEIRVHGVGDHDYLSALGRSRVRQFNSWVETAEAPVVPRHRLRIVNWSRSNRRNTGFLWYLAFPFTLVNVAGRMHGSAATGTGGRLLRLCVGSMGLILSVTQLAWLVVLAETVLRHLPMDGGGAAAGRATVIAVALGLAGWLLYRWRTVITDQDESRAAVVSRRAVTHVVAILTVGLLLAWFRPAQLAYSGWPAVATPLQADGSDQAATVERLDAMALWIAVSTGAAFFTAALLLLWYWVARPDARRARAPEAAAGVLLVTAVLLLHSVTSLLRMVLDNILVYVTGLFGGSSLEDPSADHSGSSGFTAGRNTNHAILLAYDSSVEAADSRIDLFPFLALIVAGAALAAAVVVLAVTPSLGVHHLWGTTVARGRWLHRLVGVAPSLVPRILPLTGFFAAGGIAAAVTLGEGRLGGPWLALAILVLHLAGAGVILVLLLGQLAPVRSVLGKVADIAGFWPIRDHPLAGVSYREAVVAGIRAETLRSDVGQVVLVAHSQGSVICAWLLAGLPATEPSRPLLITAGSPLSSLYAAFFPAYFTPDLFRRVSGGSHTTTWVNLWRDTDPIGTAIPGADNRQVADPDPEGTVRGHSDYWTSSELVEEVRRLREVFPDQADVGLG